MPFSVNDAPIEIRNAVQFVEDRADECYTLLRLLKWPANEARWALLTAMALRMELCQQQFGANNPPHKITIVTLDRCTCGFKFISECGEPVSESAENYAWHGLLIQDATSALHVTEQYTHFLDVFPMWHKGREKVDVEPDGRVRFYIPEDSPRQRQVIAFQQGNRPAGTELVSPYAGPSKADSPEAFRLLDQLLHEARPGGTAKKFSYEPTRALVEALRPIYQNRLEGNFRHPDGFQLSGHSLGEFKSFYVALLTLCSIHEYICHPFDKPASRYPPPLW
jgi:hypothetical protein